MARWKRAPRRREARWTKASIGSGCFLVEHVFNVLIQRAHSTCSCRVRAVVRTHSTGEADKPSGCVSRMARTMRTRRRRVALEDHPLQHLQHFIRDFLARILVFGGVERLEGVQQFLRFVRVTLG